MTVAPPPEVEFEHPADWDDLLNCRTDRARFVYVPYRRYFMVEGDARPGSDQFQAAIGSLYPVAYALHFALKRRGVVARVGMIEGLYWVGEPGPIELERFAETSPSAPLPMSWRLMIAVPDEATEEEVDAAVDEVRHRGSASGEQLDRMRCRGWLEGEAAQIMHVGPYDAEYPTEARLCQAMADAGLRARGCHHEIYLSQPSAPPEKTRTLLRQPVEEIAW